jgi:hypothetical protein
LARSRAEGAVVGKKQRGAMTAGEIAPASLEELALNLRSSWNHRTDELWARLVPRHPEAVVPLEAPEILWQR